MDAFKHAAADYAKGLIDHHGEGEARAIAQAILAKLDAPEPGTVTGPYDKAMREDADGRWSWKTYTGEWFGRFASQGECEANIRIHCGD